MSKDTKGLMRVTVQIGDRRFDEDLSGQLFIAPDLAGIDEALEMGPQRTGEWAMLAGFAKTEHDRIKSNLSVLEARILLEVLAAPPPGIKPTVDAVKALVESDPRRLAMQEEFLAAAERLRTLEIGRDALRDRKDYIIERARDARAEMQARMTVRLPDGETMDRYKPGGR
jgi:hypothetical protein